MNTPSNLKIVDETEETRQKVFYVERINPKLPWPSNAVLADFVTGGKYKKFRILTIGDPNLKIVQVK